MRRATVARVYEGDDGMRTINEIIIHCAATQPDWKAGEPLTAKVAEIRRWHRDRGWSDIGYHFIIDRDGQVAPGRGVDRAGAHVAGRNAKTIGISLLGGHASNSNDKFADHFTLEQDKALRGLISDLRQKYPSITAITGHNEYAAKACPGFQVSGWLGGAAMPRASVADYPTLRINDSGPDVKILQIGLADLGYHSGKTDGHFGKLTRAAVLAFQADNGLTTDGIAGPATRDAMKTAGPRQERDITMDDLAESGTLADLDQVDRAADVGALGGVGGAVVVAGQVSDAADTVTEAADGATGALESVTGIVTQYWPALLLLAGVAVFYLFFRGKTAQTRKRKLRDHKAGKALHR